jgi:hypothetical protein
MAGKRETAKSTLPQDAIDGLFVCLAVRAGKKERGTKRGRRRAAGRQADRQLGSHYRHAKDKD